MSKSCYPPDVAPDLLGSRDKCVCVGKRESPFFLVIAGAEFPQDMTQVAPRVRSKMNSEYQSGRQGTVGWCSEHPGEWHSLVWHVSGKLVTVFDAHDLHPAPLRQRWPQQGPLSLTPCPHWSGDPLCLSAQAAMRECHGMGSFLIAGGCKSKIKVSAGWVPGEGSLLGLQTFTFSLSSCGLCMRTVRVRESALVSLPLLRRSELGCIRTSTSQSPLASFGPFKILSSECSHIWG